MVDINRAGLWPHTAAMNRKYEEQGDQNIIITERTRLSPVYTRHYTQRQINRSQIPRFQGVRATEKMRQKEETDNKSLSPLDFLKNLRPICFQICVFGWTLHSLQTLAFDPCALSSSLVLLCALFLLITVLTFLSVHPRSFHISLSLCSALVWCLALVFLPRTPWHHPDDSSVQSGFSCTHPTGGEIMRRNNNSRVITETERC